MNNDQGLYNTVMSVITQTYKNYEFIVIDGDSTDGSKNIIEKYSEKFSYHVSEPDNGIYQAMNKGIEVATGKFLLFLNSGDCLLNNDVLSNVSSFLDNTEIVSGDLITQNAAGIQLLKVSPPSLDDVYLMCSTIWHPSTFIQKKLFTKIGYYNESYKIVADYDFFLRAIVKHKASYKHAQIPVSLFGLDGISNDPTKYSLMHNERRRVQQSIFTHKQLQELNKLEIQFTGRQSKLFKYVPKGKLLLKVFDKFYYHWYKLTIK